MNNNFLYLNFINFTDVSLWDFKRYAAKKFASSYPIVKLGNYIQEENTKVKPFDFPDKDFPILGVNNKTGLFDAYIEKGSNINQPYKVVKDGFLAYNPYRVNVGSIGLKTAEQKYNYISPAYVVFSCRQGLLPEFLYILFRTNKFNIQIRESTTGSVRQTLSFSSMGNIEIPLPSIEKQKEIVEKYNSKIMQAYRQEKEASNLAKKIEQILFEKLGILADENQQISVNSSVLSFINYSFISRWGVEFLKNDNASKKLLKSNSLPMEKLGSLVEIDPKNNFSDLEKDLEMSFIPMECVSDENGEVISSKVGCNAQSKGYTRFQDGDLIWAKITPCMQNGKSAILKDLKNGYGYGSTEFYVIRNTNPEVHLDYIYHILRTDIVLKNAMTFFTGSSGQQRVPKSYLENLEIPLPDFATQVQISNDIYEIKSRIKEIKTNAEKCRVEAIIDFEKELFE